MKNLLMIFAIVFVFGCTEDNNNAQINEGMAWGDNWNSGEWE